jgi:hypothetical protein
MSLRSKTAYKPLRSSTLFSLGAARSAATGLVAFRKRIIATLGGLGLRLTSVVNSYIAHELIQLKITGFTKFYTSTLI